LAGAIASTVAVVVETTPFSIAWIV